MSALLRSRLLSGRLSGKFYGVRRSAAVKPFNTSAAAEPVAAAESLLNDQPPPKKSLPLQFLKFSLFSALTGAIGATSYATYAYTLDEVEKKAATMCESLKVPDVDNATGLDKYLALVHSGAMQVSLKAIEQYADVRRYIEDLIQVFSEPASEKLLPDLLPEQKQIFTLVLDLNETLVYSDWKRDRGWRTYKRPGVEAFLEHLSKYYEIVVFSDQLDMYVSPIIQRLNQQHGCIHHGLSRSATKYQNGKHYRDLSKLNRDPAQVIYLSGNPESTFQHENYVHVKPWKLENDDTALLDFIPFLEYVAMYRPADIRPVLASYQGCDNIPAEFIKRHKDHERRKQRSSFWRRSA